MVAEAAVVGNAVMMVTAVVVVSVVDGGAVVVSTGGIDACQVSHVTRTIRLDMHIG